MQHVYIVRLLYIVCFSTSFCSNGIVHLPFHAPFSECNRLTFFHGIQSSCCIFICINSVLLVSLQSNAHNFDLIPPIDEKEVNSGRQHYFSLPSHFILIHSPLFFRASFIHLNHLWQALKARHSVCCCCVILFTFRTEYGIKLQHIIHTAHKVEHTTVKMKGTGEAAGHQIVLRV